MARPADEPIHQSVAISIPVERAFAAFADLARWWPLEYTRGRRHSGGHRHRSLILARYAASLP